jgi:hypothetical protein
MTSAGFELTISTGEGPQTYALDGSATGNGLLQITEGSNLFNVMLQELQAQVQCLQVSNQSNIDSNPSTERRQASTFQEQKEGISES